MQIVTCLPQKLLNTSKKLKELTDKSYQLLDQDGFDCGLIIFDGTLYDNHVVFEGNRKDGWYTHYTYISKIPWEYRRNANYWGLRYVCA